MVERSGDHESALHEALARRLPDHFPIDEQFRLSLRALRLLFHIDADRWQTVLADALLLHAPRQMDDLPEAATTLRTIIARRSDDLLRMRLDRGYVDGVAELATFLALHRFPALGIFGAYAVVQRYFLRLIIVDDRLESPLMRRDAYLSLTSWITIETGLLAHFLLDDGARTDRAAIDKLFERLPDPASAGPPDAPSVPRQGPPALRILE
ncbi:MAG: hypothetical protein D6754_07405 [Alphaproteobacteria bacterium]|nr:MAG: hypothetical protein D6754_07405 [Alphaproteobacteria bacterium]